MYYDQGYWSKTCNWQGSCSFLRILLSKKKLQVYFKDVTDYHLVSLDWVCNRDILQWIVPGTSNECIIKLLIREPQHQSRPRKMVDAWKKSEIMPILWAGHDVIIGNTKNHDVCTFNPAVEMASTYFISKEQDAKCWNSRCSWFEPSLATVFVWTFWSHESKYTSNQLFKSPSLIFSGLCLEDSMLWQPWSCKSLQPDLALVPQTITIVPGCLLYMWWCHQWTLYCRCMRPLVNAKHKLNFYSAFWDVLFTSVFNVVFVQACKAEIWTAREAEGC